MELIILEAALSVLLRIYFGKRSSFINITISFSPNSTKTLVISLTEFEEALGQLEDSFTSPFII